MQQLALDPIKIKKKRAACPYHNKQQRIVPMAENLQLKPRWIAVLLISIEGEDFGGFRSKKTFGLDD